MRMPIFSYFLVVGSVLTGLLVWLGDNRELESAPVKTSQTLGVPQPFKGKPESMRESTPASRAESMPDLSNVNFAAARSAAEREGPREKPAKVTTAPKPRQKTLVRSSPPAPRNAWFAEYPQNNWISFR